MLVFNLGLEHSARKVSFRPPLIIVEAYRSTRSPRSPYTQDESVEHVDRARKRRGNPLDHVLGRAGELLDETCMYPGYRCNQ